MVTQEHLEATGLDDVEPDDLREVVRSFPTILERLRSSYRELEARATHVEDELCRKVDELDGLRNHLEAVLRSLPCGVVVRDANGRVVEMNQAAESLLGATVAELGVSGAHPALQGERADGKPHEVETADGRRLVLASSYSIVRAASGEVDGSVEILDDHTELAEVTERLHAGDKMAALGTMAAGIAHEIRNPLNAVKGFASLLQKLPHEDEKTRRWCKLIVEATAEADAIIEGMLSFGSPERLRLEAVDGARLIAEAVKLALPEDESRVQVTQSSDVGPFRADHIKLRQAIRNLVANAIDAQRGSGAPACVHVSITQDGDDVAVRVTDAGPGVGPRIRHRIFDPFFTNHPDGTGLGLALVSTIVRLHGGSVRVSPEPSDLGGADFTIRIPFQPVYPAEIPHQPLEG